MAIQSRLHEFDIDSLRVEATIVADAGAAGKHPVVLVFHAWAGQDDFARDKARRLAELGYIGLAVDLFGKGRRGSTREECSALMTPLVQDRALLKRRIEATAAEAARVPGADTARLGAIGYCFGGLCALDLARAGVPGVRGVASFHGLLTPPGWPAGRITAKVLALHGYDDPMSQPDSLRAFCNEMTAAGADWEVNAYGATVHAFTNQEANDPAFGTVYSAQADARSWARTTAFLAEVLG